MERTLPHDDHAPPGVKSWQLWFSLGAGMAAWAIHMMIVYPLTSLTCEWGWFPFTLGSLSGLQVVQVIATFIAAPIALLAGYYASQNLRRLGNGEEAGSNRHHFMAYLGFTLSIIFFSMIMLALIPILALPVCG